MTAAPVSRRTLFRSAGAVAAVGAVGTALPSRADVLLTAGPAAASSATEPLQLARVWASGVHQRRKLAGFDDTHVVYDDGSVQYLLWPGDLARLRATGLKHEIEVADVARHDALAQVAAQDAPSLVATQPGETATGDYRVLADYEREMRALAKKHPTRARLLELPHRTLEGRTVYGLEIATNVTRRDGRPVFYQDGCHHAREWPASEVPIMWAYDLLDNYGKDKRIKAIVDNVRTIVVPVVNVDGYHYSRSFPPVETGEVGGQSNPLPPEGIVLGGQGRYIRKNRRPLGSTHAGEGLGSVEQRVPAEANGYVGIDPNRNYAYQWGDDDGGSSPVMTDATYRGSDPFSEQESKNVAHVLKSHHVTAMITNHTSGNLLLWAWGDTKADAPDNDLLEGLGRAMAVYNKYKPQKSIQLYVTTGTTSDYAYGALSSIGYTFEHAGSSFHPPYKTTVPAMYAKNRDAFILLATYGCIPPEKRPALALKADATDELAEMKITSKRLAHAIISGRVVDAQGRPVRGTLSITKAFETELWQKGTKNPLGQKVFREFLDTSMETTTDGRFEWHVNPSTRPAVAAARKTEAYVLAITGPKGTGISRRLVVKRGQRINLGTVVVS